MFGKVGDYYYQVVRAEDNRPVNPNRIRKSIGAERSFSADLQRIPEMEAALARIAQEVHERLKANKRAGYTITLKIKYGNYDAITRSQTLTSLIQEPAEIMRLARGLLLTHVESARSVRLLGITVSNLAPPETSRQLHLDFANNFLG